MMSNFFQGFALLALIGLGVADSSAQIAIPPDQQYKVLPGDVLEVSVWGEENLQREVLVRPDGMFSFPLCGDISATNRTVTELREEVRNRLTRYISDPVVTVSVSEILGNKIYVIGQVNDPGVFVVNPQVDVLQALSLAGGTTAFADLNGIRILRRANQQQRAIEFRYNDVVKGRNLEQNIILQSGDVIVVP